MHRRQLIGGPVAPAGAATAGRVGAHAPHRRILAPSGTRFLGPAAVEAAVNAGHGGRGT